MYLHKLNYHLTGCIQYYNHRYMILHCLCTVVYRHHNCIHQYLQNTSFTFASSTCTYFDDSPILHLSPVQPGSHTQLLVCTQYPLAHTGLHKTTDKIKFDNNKFLILYLHHSDHQSIHQSTGTSYQQHNYHYHKRNYRQESHLN